MIRIKGIYPTLREKKRYLVYKVLSEKEINIEAVNESIKHKLMSFMGALNYGRAGIMFLNLKSKDKGIIKANVSLLDQVRAGLALIKSIGEIKVILNILGVSGILNKASKRYD